MKHNTFDFLLDIDLELRDFGVLSSDTYSLLVDFMNRCAKSYYKDCDFENPIDDITYDLLYKILEKYERENPSEISKQSPTQYVGY